MNRKINASMRHIQPTRTHQRIIFGIILLLLASICGVWAQTTSAVPPPSGTSAGAILTENLGNGVTLEMAAIPGGNFLMGSPDSEKDRKKDEGPQHSVTTKPFLNN